MNITVYIVIIVVVLLLFYLHSSQNDCLCSTPVSNEDEPRSRNNFNISRLTFCTIVVGCNSTQLFPSLSSRIRSHQAWWYQGWISVGESHYRRPVQNWGPGTLLFREQWCSSGSKRWRWRDGSAPWMPDSHHRAGNGRHHWTWLWIRQQTFVTRMNCYWLTRMYRDIVNNIFNYF